MSCSTIDKHRINFHTYANISQIYAHCDCCDTASAAALLEHCITNISDWMSANRLKLNADKKELLWTNTKHSLSLLNGCDPSLCLGENTITPSEHVHVLCITISFDISLDKKCLRSGIFQASTTPSYSKFT